MKKLLTFKDGQINWTVIKVFIIISIASLLSCSDTNHYKNVHPVPRKEVKQEVRLIGRWKDERPGADCIISIYVRNDKFYMKHKFDDGSSCEDEMKIGGYDGLEKYEAIDNPHNEYYIIEKNGDLSMCGQDGKFATAFCF